MLKKIMLLKRFSAIWILIIGTGVLYGCVYIFYPKYLYCVDIKAQKSFILMVVLAIISLEYIILVWCYKLSHNSSHKLASFIPLFSMLYFCIGNILFDYIKHISLNIDGRWELGFLLLYFISFIVLFGIVKKQMVKSQSQKKNKRFVVVWVVNIIASTVLNFIIFVYLFRGLPFSCLGF